MPNLFLQTDVVFRTSDPNGSFASTKIITGPATTVWVWRTIKFPSSGCALSAMKVATGPLIPGGTTHWSIGREMVTFKVPGPVSI